MTLRWLGVTVLVALALGGVFVGQASTAGPGGWDHVGDAGTAGTKSLNGNVSALNTDWPGQLLVGGAFTDAGGNALADYIASWNGTQWAPVGAAGQQITGGVFALAYANGRVYAGGSFLNAGGDQNADFLAVWDGQTWSAFCTSAGGGPAFGGNVKALQVIGPTLYVGGEFQDGAGIPGADYLVACDLNSGAARSTIVDPLKFFSGPVYALTADSNGVLYAGGGFTNLEGIPQADYVAYSPTGSGWQPMGAGAGPCSCAVTTFVRSLTAVGTDVYVGTDATDVDGIAQADHVARWNGAVWSALGSRAGGADGWFPAVASIDALVGAGSKVFAAGSFQDADGDPTADSVAVFDGTAWHPVGSDGAGNGPLNAKGNALAVFPLAEPRRLYAGGSFTSAGGDTQASRIAAYSLAGLTPTPTPVPTPTPGPVPTPVPTPTPDTTAPVITVLKLSRTTFRAARSGPPFRAAAVPVGATVTFTLSERGAVRFTIDRAVAGRTVKGRCVKPSRANRARPRCRRWVAQPGSFTVAGAKGSNRIVLRGRIGGRTLAPGVYRLAARETDPAANRSRVKRTGFRIVR